jgi:cytochrome c oxidase subunit 3
VSGGHDSHDSHGHGGSRFIQHHYDDAQHQFDAGKLGIWLFLAQEVLFFSALFVAYVLYRVHHPEIYAYAHKWLQVKFGAINTGVLIFSSLTAAWAVRCAQLNQRKGLILCIAVTIACACGFLSIKYIEYSHKIHEHILFGRYFDPCVTSGNDELLTKRNECAGSKSNVVFDLAADKASTGCLEIAKIDQDPKTPGVQAKCTVTEVHAQKSTPITHMCPQKVLEPEIEGEAVKPEEKEVFPCWEPSYQPAVCKEKAVGILVVYGDTEERGEDYKINATCEDAPKAAAAPDMATDTHDPMVASNPVLVGTPAIVPHQHTLTAHEAREFEEQQLIHGPPPEHTNMFLTVYFAMTGLHGIHVLVGIFVFLWLLFRSIRGDFTPEYFGPIDFAALYWHIVDLIWIFLFPLLYLIH